MHYIDNGGCSLPSDRLAFLMETSAAWRTCSTSVAQRRPPPKHQTIHFTSIICIHMLVWALLDHFFRLGETEKITRKICLLLKKNNYSRFALNKKEKIEMKEILSSPKRIIILIKIFLFCPNHWWCERQISNWRNISPYPISAVPLVHFENIRVLALVRFDGNLNINEKAGKTVNEEKCGNIIPVGEKGCIHIIYSGLPLSPL